jgi:hypothetical protein
MIMRRRLIEALTYPRLFVLKEIDLKDCPHDSVFEGTCDRCHNCGLGQECHWLSCLNDFADMSDKSVHTLHASLLYSIKMIHGHFEKMRHHSRFCDCEPCNWTRDAKRLSRTFSRQYDRDISSIARSDPLPTRTIS